MRLKKVIGPCLAILGLALFQQVAQADECSDLYGAKKYQQAYSVCQKLANKNDRDALFTLGLMYNYGHGALEDQREAFAAFKRAAKLGHAGAQNNLGYYYFNGVTVAQDYKRAFLWFSLAAAMGFEEAQSFRDMAAKHLSAEEKSQAQAMAKACRNSTYEMCE
jgi:uncharacterized protein